MLRQLKYFQAVVENKNFSKAAEQCFISQSAISQQVRALEQELGVTLLWREGRGFSVTPAGEVLFRKSRFLTAEWDRLVKEVQETACGNRIRLRLGYLRSYSGPEFRHAIFAFSRCFPQADLHLTAGNHEELYELLVSGRTDLLFSDQRRTFSDGYFNEILASRPYRIETGFHHPIAQYETINAEDLNDLSCILVCSPGQEETEADYYRDMIGLKSGFLFVPTLEEGRLLAAAGKGVLLIEGSTGESVHAELRQIPVTRRGQPLLHNYCAFWSREDTGSLSAEFAALLKTQFGV